MNLKLIIKISKLFFKVEKKVNKKLKKEQDQKQMIKILIIKKLNLFSFLILKN